MLKEEYKEPSEEEVFFNEKMKIGLFIFQRNGQRYRWSKAL